MKGKGNYYTGVTIHSRAQEPNATRIKHIDAFSGRGRAFRVMDW